MYWFSLFLPSFFRSYSTALVSVCDSGLLGIIILLISSAISGFLFTTLVWCNSHTWIYFKHKGRYIKVDDQDPYMPLSTIERPRMTPMSAGSVSGIGPYMDRHPSQVSHRGPRTLHTPPQTPPYHGTLNGHSSMGAHHVAYGTTTGHGLSQHHQAATLGGHGHHLPHAHPKSNIGTLGRNTHSQHSA